MRYISRRTTKLVAIGVGVCLFLSTLSSRASALDPKKAITQYIHNWWGPEQGLTQKDIWAIVQTHDGYLWIGTMEGLCASTACRSLYSTKETRLDLSRATSSAFLWIAEASCEQNDYLIALDQISRGTTSLGCRTALVSDSPCVWVTSRDRKMPVLPLQWPVLPRRESYHQKCIGGHPGQDLSPGKKAEPTRDKERQNRNKKRVVIILIF